jgi:phosphoribosyl-AMP cyclohydrolase
MVSREIERRIPIAAKLMMSEEPPALMNGSVIPVIGTSVTTTAMLMNAWMHSHAVMPAASSAPNVSGAPSATRIPA